MEIITPLINGKTYSWGDIAVVIFGKRIVGITAINYDQEQEKENVYGAGNVPVNRGYGNKKYSASITLLSDEVTALEQATPNGDLTDIPAFDIVVSYMNDQRGVVTHILKSAEFTKDSRSSKQNDSKIEIELPLIIAPIIWKA